MKKTFFVSIVLLVLAGGNARAETYNVRQFGAKGDGKTLDTAAIQKALDQCKENGGTVVLPEGTYLSRPLDMHDKTTLQINQGATLKATDATADYLIPGTTNEYRAFIEGTGPTSLKLTGHGTIDGSGARWWTLAAEARGRGHGLPRPYLVHFTNCASVHVDQVTLQNSARFHFVPDFCDNVLVENIRIFSPTNATTTEGITAGLCRNMTVRDCTIECTSDSVDFKADYKVPGREFACENLTVENCVLRRGRGVAVGSETRGGVRKVIVRNCSFADSENGVRIKSARGRGGVVQDVVFENIILTNVISPLTIAQYYPAVLPRTNMPVTPLTPRFSNLFITNLTATGSTEAGMVVGLPESRINNVVLQNVRVDAGKGFMIRDADNVVLKNVQVSAAQGPAFLVEEAQVTGLPD